MIKNMGSKGTKAAATEILRGKSDKEEGLTDVLPCGRVTL